MTPAEQAELERELAPWRVVGYVAGTIGALVGTYHGYARNHSVGWALGWGFLGGLAPVVVIPIALAQGLGKPRPGLGHR
jgi:hypothetical protein